MINKILFTKFLLVLLFFSCLINPSLDAEDHTLKIGVYENPPKIFTDESAEPAGIFIDIIKYIANKEGWHLEFISGSWGDCLERLARGEIDLMPDVAYTAGRDKIYSFHKTPVLSSWSQVYARKGSGIESILDLAGLRIAVLKGSVQEEAFVRLFSGFDLEAKIITAPDYQTIFEMAAKNEADAAITNRYNGVMHAEKYHLEDTAVIFNPCKLYFAAAPGFDSSLLDIIDRHLKEMKKDPESVYYDSLRHWTSEEIHFTLPAWMQTLILVATLGLLISLAASVVLRYQINTKTRELRQINQEMEQRITDRTTELEFAKERAQSADRIKSAFLATMSHELRTPLNSIIGFTGILLQDLAGPLNEEQNKQMTMVQGSARHLLALINDVLDISKIEAGQLEISITSCEANDTIMKMVELIKPMAQKKKIEIKLFISDAGIVSADQRRLAQVVLNLLNNAVKFTEKGYVHVECHNTTDRCILSVSDTGIGIPAQEIPHLFEPFHQINTGISRTHEGTGLGLSICKRLLDLMGGSIEVKSQEGKGTTFTVSLPKEAGGKA